MTKTILTLILCVALISCPFQMIAYSEEAVEEPSEEAIIEVEEEVATVEETEGEAQVEEKEQEAKRITLPAGTPLNLVMIEGLYSQRNRQGDEIIFTLAEDVVLMGKTYLVKGTPVLGRVVGSKQAKSWGRAGSIDIEVRSIHPIYSMPIPLCGEGGHQGGTDTMTSVASVALLGITGVGLLVGGSISGKGARINAGTTFTVYTAEEGEIMDIPHDEMREAVDNWFRDKIITSFLNYSWDGNPNIGSSILRLGYQFDKDDIIIEDLQDFTYRITVVMNNDQRAIFTIQPFEQPHIGKFRTIKGENDIAERIIDASN